MENYRYEVWVLGFDQFDMCTDVETLLATFETPEQAVAYAQVFERIKDVTNNIKLNYDLEEGDYLEIVVETIKEDDETNTNIDTKYQAYLY